MGRNNKNKRRARIRREFRATESLKTRLIQGEDIRRDHKARESQVRINRKKFKEATEENAYHAVLITNAPYTVDRAFIMQWVIDTANILLKSIVSCDIVLERGSNRPHGQFHVVFSDEDAIERLKTRALEVSKTRNLLGRFDGRNIYFRVLSEPFSDRRLRRSPRYKTYRLTRVALAEQNGKSSFAVRWAVPDMMSQEDDHHTGKTAPLVFEVVRDHLRWSLMFGEKHYEFRSYMRDLKRQIDVEVLKHEQLMIFTIYPMIPPEVWRITSSPVSVSETRVTDFTGCGVIGACLVYRLNLQVNLGEAMTLLRLLARYGLCADPDGPQKTINNYVKKVSEESIDKVNEKLARDVIVNAVRALDFDVRYRIEVAVSKGNISRSALDAKFYRDLQHMKKRSAINLLDKIASEDFFEAKPWTRLIRYIRFNEDGTAEEEKLLDYHNKANKGMILMRRLTVTPTRCYYHEVEHERSNRVLRHYTKHRERFLRVSFRDENFEKVSMRSDELFERIKNYMSSGIEVAGRFYRFLAFSSSQLKEGSAWFFADLPGTITVEGIRSWMGDFSSIRNVSKYAARMGQCFSSTYRGVDVSEEDWIRIADVESGGYTFSDGCGLISSKLGKKLAKRARIKKPDNGPSAFQIRFNGCKGMVTIWDDLVLEQRCGRTGLQLLIRESMYKFDVRHEQVEVLEPSCFYSGFLNRQVITVLSTRRVPDDRFINLQDNMLRSLDKIFDSAEDAHDVIAQMSGGDEAGKYGMVSMIEAGFSLWEEPFLHEQLLSCRRLQVKRLESKARIFVPEAANLFGVMDETNTLEYGEVFVQICGPTTDGQNFIVADCDVVVGKNPMLHPGDVRVLRARADVPESLKKIVNCVVFPSKGPRPHTDECSGSDLDGDRYFVSWCEDLIPREKESPPMDYKAAPPLVKSSPVTIQDIVDFFITFAKNDNLGLIANCHLALADLSVQYAHDIQCKRLAELHSMAVDFPKTGVPAILERGLRSPSYPDFLGKSQPQSHKSNKVLGKMYRSVKEFSRRAKVFEDTGDLLSAFPQKVDEDLILEGFQKFYAEAKTISRVYQDNLREIMTRFGVENEIEMLTGTVSRFSSQHFSQGRLFETRKLLSIQVSRFRQRFKRLFRYGDTESGDESESDDEPDNNKMLYDDPGLSGESENEAEDSSSDMSTFDEDTELYLLQRASAFYQVAYEQAVMYRKDPSVSPINPLGLLSFPWVCALPQLCKIKAIRVQERMERANIRAEALHHGKIEGKIERTMERKFLDELNALQIST